MDSKHRNAQINIEFQGLCTDFGSVSLNKKGETVCGDYYHVVESGEDGHVLVLSDGLGSGVKANILATLTASMLSNMIAKKLSIHDAVLTVADTLPICSVRHLAYATFTVLDIQENAAALYQFDNPDAILIREGHVWEYPFETVTIGDKTIHESTLSLQEDDMLILMSDGVTNAGMGKTTNGGWGREEVVRFCREHYKQGMSAQEMACDIAYAGYALNMDETDDDLTVLVLRFCRRQTVNLMIGPPKDPSRDQTYMQSFFESEGKHVICGGSTTKLAAAYLGKTVSTIQGSEMDDVPSLMRLEGVDLATEGLLTLERLLEYCEDLQDDPLIFHQLKRRKDGAAQLGNLLFSWATDIRVYFGNAQNEAYQTGELASHSKRRQVELLIDHLKAAGKRVQLAFWAV